MNIVIIALIIIVIYLISQNMPKKEDFKEPISMNIDPKYSNEFNNKNIFNQCYYIDKNNCTNPYWSNMCSDKCKLLNNQKPKKKSRL